MIQKGIHIILTLFVLLSSTGLVVNRHFCQNELKDQRLFLQAHTCHPKMMEVPCPVHGTMLVESPAHGQGKGCCQNESEVITSDVELQTPPVELQISPVLWVMVFAPFTWEAILAEVPTPQYLHYKPPLLVCDSIVSLQTFRC